MGVGACWAEEGRIVNPKDAFSWREKGVRRNGFPVIQPHKPINRCHKNGDKPGALSNTTERGRGAEKGQTLVCWGKKC